MIPLDPGPITTMLAAIVAVETAQLGVMWGNRDRSKRNERVNRALAGALGIDPDDPPTYQLDPEAIPDGGRRDP